MLPDSSPAPEGERDHLGRFYADLDFGGRPMPAGEIKYMRQGLIPCRRCAFWVNHSCRAKAPLSHGQGTGGSEVKIATKDNVRVGDLLRRFHFTGSRRRKHYLYHVVRWNEEEQALEAVPVESIATGERSGSYWICSGVGVGAEVVESLFDHMSEEDYQAKLREIRAVAAQPMGTHAPRKS